MKKIIRKLFGFVMMMLLVAMVSIPAYAAGEADVPIDEVTVSEDDDTDNVTGDKALAAGLGIGLAALGGAVGMGMAIAKSVEGIARQPEAENKIRTALMLGLVFVETAIIYALIVVILIIFVL